MNQPQKRIEDITDTELQQTILHYTIQKELMSSHISALVTEFVARQQRVQENQAKHSPIVLPKLRTSGSFRNSGSIDLNKTSSATVTTGSF